MKRHNSKDTNTSDPVTGVRHTHDYPTWHNMASGAFAGIGARLASAPFDLLKIRLQLQQQYNSSMNVFQCFSKIIREEGGVRALFRGNVAATYLWVGYAAVQFSLYAKITGVLNDFIATDYVDHSIIDSYGNFESSDQAMSSSLSLLVHQTQTILSSNPSLVAFVSGASAGVCATLATYPFDICRTNFAASSSSAISGFVAHKSLLSYAKYTFQARGLSGFFVGIGPAIVQIIPYMGINFAVYDHLVRMSKLHNVGSVGAAGSIAGGTSKLIVYPMDTVKKRLQAQSFGRENVAIQTISGAGGSSGTGRYKYTGMIDCLATITKEEGFSALYKGLAPTVMKSMIATGVSFACFAFSKNVLESIYDSSYNQNEEDDEKS